MSITQLVSQETFCKCCDDFAYLYDVVDLNKNCNVQKPYALSGIPIYYYKCTNCGFIFTENFDDFSKEDFATHIYNDKYVQVDPEYVEIRPKNNAEMIEQLLSGYKHLEILDYGGGNGLVEKHLKDLGYQSVNTYDPFSDIHHQKPEKKFDGIVCFEVIEHSVNPKEIFTDIFSLLKEDGFVLFSSLLQPEGIDSIKCGWWYAGPRNGHVSLHSVDSLNAIAEIFDCNFVSFNSSLHAMFHVCPEFITNIKAK